METIDNEARGAILAALENALANYTHDLELARSPLTRWHIVKSRLTTVTSPEQSGRAVRVVLDLLIDSLRHDDPNNFSTVERRRYTIADALYRQGAKPGEIYRDLLPISRSQFYRERDDVLAVLAERAHEWEQQIIHEQQKAISRQFTTLPPLDSIQLFSVDKLIEHLVTQLLTPRHDGLYILSGLAGVGKTAIALAVVKRVLGAGAYRTIAWIDAQQEIFSWGKIKPTTHSILTTDQLLTHLVHRVTRPVQTLDQLFSELDAVLEGQDITFDSLLEYLADNPEMVDLSASQKLKAIEDALTTQPGLIVIDGIEAVDGDLEAILDSLWHIVQQTGSKVLVTSRLRFDHCQYAYALHLGPLKFEDAAAFVRHYAAKRGLAAIAEAHGDDIALIVNTSGAVPLAMIQIVNQLNRLPLMQVISDWQSVGMLSRPFYSFMYRRLSQTWPQSAWQVLNIVANQPEGSLSWYELRNCAQLTDDALISILELLMSAHVMEFVYEDGGIYHVDLLTRQFLHSDLMRDWSNQSSET